MDMEVDRIEVMTPQETINTEAQVAPGGAARVGRSWRCSDVWQYFHLSTGRGAVTATCKRCGETLRASSKKHGTSRLWRHVGSKKCKKLQQQQAPLLPAPQASPQLNPRHSSDAYYEDPEIDRQEDGGE